ncbi:MAG: hypothetical protein ACE5J5_05315 [Candidatus Hydrothermarchaeales archaeon]
MGVGGGAVVVGAGVVVGGAVVVGAGVVVGGAVGAGVVVGRAVVVGATVVFGGAVIVSAGMVVGARVSGGASFCVIHPTEMIRKRSTKMIIILPFLIPLTSLLVIPSFDI